MVEVSPSVEEEETPEIIEAKSGATTLLEVMEFVVDILFEDEGENKVESRLVMAIVYNLFEESNNEEGKFHIVIDKIL